MFVSISHSAEQALNERNLHVYRFKRLRGKQEKRTSLDHSKCPKCFLCRFQIHNSITLENTCWKNGILNFSARKIPVIVFTTIRVKCVGKDNYGLLFFLILKFLEVDPQLVQIVISPFKSMALAKWLSG